MTALLGASVAQPRTITLARPARTTAQWQRRYLLRAALLDISVGLIGALLGLLRFEPGRTGTPYLVLTVVLPVAWLLCLAVGRAYEPRFLFVGNDEYRRVTNAALWLTALLVGSAYAVNFELARGYVLITLPVIALGTLAGRHLLRHRLHLSRARGLCMRPVLVMGYERAVAGLCSQLQRLPQHGMSVVGALLPADRIRPGALSDVGVPVVGTFDDATDAVARTGARIRSLSSPARNWTPRHCADWPGNWRSPAPT